MLAKRNCVWLPALALGFVALTPADALAYVDPGSSSYLFQLAAAGFFASIFTLRRYWDALRSRFSGQAPILPRRDQPNPDE
jgi:hypothetical protein